MEIKFGDFKTTRITNAYITCIGVHYGTYCANSIPYRCGVLFICCRATPNAYFQIDESTLHFLFILTAHWGLVRKPKNNFMKRLFIILCAALTYSGCSVTFQNAIISHDFSQDNVEKRMKEEDYHFVKMVTGEASATYVFTIGGLSERAKNIFKSSYEDMVSNANLQPNQAIINVTAEKRVNLFFYPLYSKQVVHTSGTVIEFGSKGTTTVAVKPVESTKTYKVGDLYVIGQLKCVVVAVSEDGKHGKCICYDGQARKWSNAYRLTEANHSYDGSYNCVILSSFSRYDYPAMEFCGNGWYIPSKNEMKIIFENLQTVNNAMSSAGLYRIDKNKKFWTSTETSAQEAVAIVNGQFSFMNKTEKAYLIMMRTF